MNPLVKLLVRLLIFLPAALLLFIVYLYSDTLFYADDFHLLKTIVWMQDTDSWAERLQLLIQQHNEHRILFPRLLTWLDYQLEGHINWVTLMLLGNLLWCGVLYFLWQGFRTLKLSLWYFLPIPWLLFQPAYYDNYTWSISILQQSLIVFLLAWLVQAFARRQFVLASFLLVLGTFTHGNGIFGLLVGIVFLIVYREWRMLGVWATLGLLIAAAYFYGFEKGQNADFMRSLAEPVRLVGYFLAFFGSLAQVFGLPSWVSVLWGGVVFGGICWFGFPRLHALYRSNRPLSHFDKMLLGNLLFLGITALLVAVSRSWSAEDFRMAPRYAHYSPYLTAWFYLVGLAVLARRAARRWAAGWGVAAAAVSLLAHLNYLGDLAYRRDWLTADRANWDNLKTFVQYPLSFNKNVREVYATAQARGVCRPTASPLAAPARRVATDSSIVLVLEKTTNTIRETNGEHYENELRLTAPGHLGGTPFLELVPDTGPPVLVPFFRGRNAYRKILTDLQLHKPELSTQVLIDNLPPGTFRLAYRSGDLLTLTKYRIEVGRDHSLIFL